MSRPTPAMPSQSMAKDRFGTVDPIATGPGLGVQTVASGFGLVPAGTGGDGRPPMLPFPGSCLVSAFPLMSGNGRVIELLRETGLFQTVAFFKIRRRDSESGYTTVVRDVLGLGMPSAFLSFFFPTRWSRYVRNFQFVHYSSPHFFHLVKYNPNTTGTVHDLIALDKSTYNFHDTPLGARFFFPRTMKYAERLKGVVTDSHAVDRQLRARFPRVNTRVIHLWTSYAFCLRNRLEARKQLGLPPDKKILLNVSTDVKRKNIELLPKIVNALDDSFLLVRIGESDSIESRFQGHRFLGLRSVSSSTYPLYFNAADVVLMPSRAEGFGVPAIEALNSMTPIVASNIDVFREILGESYPFLPHPDDVNAWVMATREAWEIGQSSSRSQGLYSEFRDYYRPERGLREFLAFYRDMNLLSPSY
jgi:glycosyltransferase involved in cell wall biosynthesis